MHKILTVYQTRAIVTFKYVTVSQAVSLVRIVVTKLMQNNKQYLLHSGGLFQQVQYSGLVVVTAVHVVKILLVMWPTPVL